MGCMNMPIKYISPYFHFKIYRYMNYTIMPVSSASLRSASIVFVNMR